jgi:hypothetical protein
MTTERLNLPVRRPLLEMLRQSEAIAGLVKLFRSITHEPPRDTEIAWEDGEAEEQPKSER